MMGKVKICINSEKSVSHLCKKWNPHITYSYHYPVTQ